MTSDVPACILTGCLERRTVLKRNAVIRYIYGEPDEPPAVVETPGVATTPKDTALWPFCRCTHRANQCGSFVCHCISWRLSIFFVSTLSRACRPNTEWVVSPTRDPFLRWFVRVHGMFLRVHEMFLPDPQLSLLSFGKDVDVDRG